MALRRNVCYSRLDTDEDGCYSGIRQNDPRFDYTAKALDRIPWKSIALALFLLFLGTTLLFLSYFIIIGHMGPVSSLWPSSPRKSKLPPRMIYEAIATFQLCKIFIFPLIYQGFYETQIAYYAWRGAHGYRFASIPDY